MKLSFNIVRYFSLEETHDSWTDKLKESLKFPQIVDISVDKSRNSLQGWVFEILVPSEEIKLKSFSLKGNYHEFSILIERLYEFVKFTELKFLSLSFEGKMNKKDKNIFFEFLKINKTLVGLRLTFENFSSHIWDSILQ